MANDEPSSEDLDVEIRCIVEYGYALAAAAERSLRYPEVLRNAGPGAERDAVRAAYRGFLRRTIGSTTVIQALLDGDSSPGVKGT